MNEHRGSASGAVVYWSVSISRRDLLAAKLATLCLDDYQPAQRTHAACLKAALGAIAKAKVAASGQQRKEGYDVVVEPRRRTKDGFVVAEVWRGKQGEDNQRASLFGVRSSDDGELIWDQGYSADRRQVQATFEAEQKLLTGSSVGQTLVKIAAHLNAVTLRKAGGVYWLPEESLDTWNQVANAVEECSLEPETTAVDRFRVHWDEQAVRAVRRAITDEVTEAAKLLAEEVYSGELGEEALRSRRKALARLHERVEFYESELGQGLNSLHQAIRLVEESQVLMALESCD